MRIDIITVLPEMLEGFVHESILARAEKKGLAEIRLHNLRDYTKDKWRRVDDYPLCSHEDYADESLPILSFLPWQGYSHVRILPASLVIR